MIIKFKKEYTRDTTMVIQQAWTTTLEKHRDELGLSSYTDVPLVYHYLHDGVIEIWENTAWTPDLLQKMLEQNIAGSATFDRHIIAHLEALNFLKPFWGKGYTTDLKELTDVVDNVFDHMYDFDWLYYPSLDERTPDAIKTKARALRDVDVYFDRTDRFIRSSLVAIYPEIQGYEQGILRNEINDPPAVTLLTERKKNFLVRGEGESYVGTLETYQALHPQFVFEIDAIEKNMSELRGQVGSKGSARGIVRIMKRKEQVSEMIDGEILVSPMTTPDFVPAMSKAAAIVTDEGGIMCHAAIVAREMKKPCVIGTKFATQIFKDGDMVEVDADAGIVRKI